MPRLRVDKMNFFEGVESLLPDSFMPSEVRREAQADARRMQQQASSKPEREHWRLIMAGSRGAWHKQQQQQ